MGLWPLFEAAQVEPGGITAASTTTRVSVTAGAAHTKGSYVELFAALARPAAELQLLQYAAISNNGTDTSILADIAIGGAGSEVPVLSNVALGSSANQQWRFPLWIPAGSRVSIRFQCATTSKTAEFLAVAMSADGGWGGALSAPRRCTTYGANTAVSSGVAVAAPGATNTKGAWTEIVAATTGPTRLIMPLFSPVSADTVMTNSGVLVDIGVGGAGSEAPILTDLPGFLDAGENAKQVTVVVPVSIPQGARISARVQKASTVAEQLYLSILAFD